MNTCSKKRILYIHSNLEGGGAEELRFITLKSMVQRNQYDVSVCCIEKIGRIGETLKRMGVNVSCLNQTAAPYNIFATIALFFLLLNNRFDIVQTSLFNANFHGRIAAVLTGVPIVISEEHGEHYQYNSLKFLPYIWSDKILSKFTDKIICCSKNLTDYICKHRKIPMYKFFLLTNTFNKDKLDAVRDPVEVRKELGVPADSLIISNIGSLYYSKGQDILIEAFKNIDRVFPHARLILIGDGVEEFKMKLIQLVKNLGISEKVLFLGKRDNIADYLNITDMFVFSSRSEGIPLALLEAMYMGVPVVATDVGGISEIITQNKNGTLVKPGNTELLSRAVIELLEDGGRRADFIQAARKTVLERFNSGRYLSQLENLYSMIS
ncbi:MAG: glycosyltransferase [Candidatus Omnitrophota bacterium]